ncbi:uncharacterized protein EI90DRAFT_3117594 [Cantharellus anzutake]|uniref:uncharacterized protein n=1 Tax=Cantharellus anzutake TaxID=1750568 RepID=UPI001906FDC7|nr:uncharacterized protein EI90DRAFT_3117594 [Cantharellus anzutake]KAF8339840.1 hypothetical protein EI90DRAFT_3117594 [Cantharellus anzutake]
MSFLSHEGTPPMFLAGDESVIEVGVDHHVLTKLPVVARLAEILAGSEVAEVKRGHMYAQRHRFLDENAKIKYWDETAPPIDPTFNVSKGWFSPYYLHATNPTPYISHICLTQPFIIATEGPLLWHDGNHCSYCESLSIVNPLCLDETLPSRLVSSKCLHG